MSPKQQMLIENKVRQIVKKVMSEAPLVQNGRLYSSEFPGILKFVNSIEQLEDLRDVTSDPNVHNINDSIHKLKSDLMKYVERVSDSEFVKNGQSGWKLTRTPY